MSAFTGRPVNISSIARYGNRGQSNYSAAKAALATNTKTWALEFAPFGIRVGAVAPGMIETPMTQPVKDFPEMEAEILRRTPMGRWGAPEDHGGAAVFLASSASDFVTGITLPVDGGYRIR